MIKLIEKNISKCLLFVRKPIYTCFTINPYVKHHAHLTMNAQRRSFLHKSVLNQNKNVVYAELRKPTDTILSLKKQGKCAAVIIPQSEKEQQQIDIVVDGGKMRSSMSHLNYRSESVYIRLDGKQIRCVLQKLQRNFQMFIERVNLRQYIVGKPNKIRVPIQITHETENPYIQRGGQFEWKVQHIDLVCYNKDYPGRLFVDVSYVGPERPYCVGDLTSSFPAGLDLAPDVNPRLKIFQVEGEDLMQARFRKSMMEDYVQRQKNKEKEKKQSAAGKEAPTDKSATPAKGKAVEAKPAAGSKTAVGSKTAAGGAKTTEKSQQKGGKSKK